jgi:polyferredoxin
VPLAAPDRIDLLRWPLVGPLLRWRHARTLFQSVLLVAAAIVVLHGLLGPPVGSANLATVLTWVHYRGLLIVALLAAGNLFCTGCPMVRVRDWGRRLHAPSRHWPKRLRGKWIGLALFVAVLFAYEQFDLWALPAGTAYLVLAYFGLALVVDVAFTGATFCKHLCPIGQFNFVASTVSPLEVQVRDRATCQTCASEACISGVRSVADPRRVVLRGCELGLFLPGKAGNLDCTLCLDCVHACPHDNVAIAVRAPGLELADNRRRAGIGLLTERLDLAALAIVFVFGALINALGMIAPVHGLERWIAVHLGGASDPIVLGILFAAVLGAAPLAACGAAALATRFITGDRSRPAVRVAGGYAFGLVPFGVGLWAAHYLFHLLTGALVVVPVTQSAVIDVLGRPWLGEPLWRWAGVRPGAVFPIQLGILVLGTIGSVGVMSLISDRDYPDRSFRAAAPWIAVVAVLFVAAVWILYQPMEMRGLGAGG